MTTAFDQPSSTPRWHDPLLPGELRENPERRRSPRDWIVDALMYLLVLGVGIWELEPTADQHSDAMFWVDFVLGVAAVVALGWRRSHPAAVGVLTAAASIVSVFAAGAALVAAFNVALRGSRRAVAAVAAVTVVAIFVSPLLYGSGDLSGEPYPLIVFLDALLMAAVFGWGLVARARREQVLALRERAARLEAEQRLRIEQARDAERRRIAREMHDVLAHRVSLLSLHAGALEFRPDASPEEITEAAGVIRTMARSALEELREVIGVLRDGTEESALEPPQPTMADIPALVEESRAAGMRLRCQINVPGSEAASTLGRTAYRVVQEGLSNARKHAPAAEVDVTIAGGEQLVVEVVSRRPVFVAVAVAAQRLPGAGSGLIGLTERVALAGGELEHGPDAAGNFVLRATLPWKG